MTIPKPEPAAKPTHYVNAKDSTKLTVWSDIKTVFIEVTGFNRSPFCFDVSRDDWEVAGVGLVLGKLI